MLLLVFSAAVVVVRAFEVPSIEFNKVRDEAVYVRNAVATLGAIRVTGIPGLEEARSFLDAPEDLASCLRTGESAEATLDDGTRRVTVAARSNRGVPPTTLGPACSGAEELRVAVDRGSKRLFEALELPAMRPGYSMAETAHLGEHLEHLHVYEPPEKAKTETLPLHVDAGLLVSMVAGEGDATLSLELPAGDVVEIQYGGLLILAGEGMRTWLAGANVRPAPHALSVRSSRAWYGKMWLPVADAVVESTGLAFSDHRDKMLVHSTTTDYGVGCSSLSTTETTSDRRLLLGAAGGAQLCETQGGDEGIWCWSLCVDVSGIECARDQIFCVETSTGDVLDGTQHCDGHSFDDCGPVCLGDDDDQLQNATAWELEDNGFCAGNGVTMYMDGFRSVLFEDDSDDLLCVNVWMTKWTLDSKARFAIGVVGAFLTGVAIDALIFLRRKIHDSRQRSDALPLKLLALLFHLYQSILGYLAMFVAMTYNVELFFAVCLGATSGHIIFNFASTPTPNDPCCAAAHQSEALSQQDVSRRAADEDHPTPKCCALRNAASDDDDDECKDMVHLEAGSGSRF